MFFVSLYCSEAELQRRLAEPSRTSFNKLTSPDRYRELRDSGAFEFPELRADLKIDTGSLSPTMAAERIRAGLAAAQQAHEAGGPRRPRGGGTK